MLRKRDGQILRNVSYLSSSLRNAVYLLFHNRDYLDNLRNDCIVNRNCRALLSIVFPFKLLITLVIFILPGKAFSAHTHTAVEVGAERILQEPFVFQLKGKKIGLVTNQTGVLKTLESTACYLKKKETEYNYTLSALFAPEHGIFGVVPAGEIVANQKHLGIPVHSLYGENRRPTEQMLKGIEVIIFDIQDIGCRSYTYISTLFYVMEEAAKRNIQVIVLDRPNPLGGLTVDGPLLETQYRSFVGYLKIPYVHGMTVGELARYFNGEYNVKCNLLVVPMKGWKRTMSFPSTGLPWIPTSPYIPDPAAACCYGITGILGELQLVNTGVNNTIPFRLIIAPWIDAEAFVNKLKSRSLPGLRFAPIRYKPFAGRYAGTLCQGALILIDQPTTIRPVTTCWHILDCLKSLYPTRVRQGLKASVLRKDFFAKICGTDKVWNLLNTSTSPFNGLKAIHEKEMKGFMTARKKYLFPEYGP